MSRQLKHARWSAAVAGMLCVGATLGLAAPAQASTPLRVTFMSCWRSEDTLIECIARVSGGVGAYTYRWTSSTEDGDDVVFPCHSSGPATLTEPLTVTDSANSSASATASYFCPGPQAA